MDAEARPSSSTDSGHRRPLRSIPLHAPQRLIARAADCHNAPPLFGYASRVPTGAKACEHSHGPSATAMHPPLPIPFSSLAARCCRWLRAQLQLLAVLLLVCPDGCIAQAVSNPLAPNALGFIQTVWGGGVAGNSPGSSDGLLGAAALSSAGAGAWMGQSFYDWSTSTHYLLDSGHPTSLKAFNPLSSSGLSIYATFDSTSLLRAVTGDGSGALWVADTGVGVIRSRFATSTGSWAWQAAYAQWTFRNASAPTSLLYDAVNGVIYFTDSASVVRAPAASPAAQLGGGAAAQIVASLTAVSCLTWSADQRSIFLLDAGAVKQLSTSTYTTTVVAPASSFTHATALSLLPDGLSLLIADLQPAGYSVLRRVSLSPVAVTLHAANAANSSCTGVGSTYQGGTLATACWGSIQWMSLGAGAASGHVFVSESNSGRLKSIDYNDGGLVTVRVGGGTANNGYTSGTSTPSGWAPGLQRSAFFDPSMTAIIFDSKGTQGYIAQPAYGLLRSLNTLSMRADSLLGDGLYGNPAYSGTGQVGALASAVRLPAITAIARDSRDRLYWTDALGGVRAYNASSGVTSNFCATNSTSGCTRLSGSAPSSSASYSCSQLCFGTYATGIAFDAGTNIAYVAFNDTQGVGSVLMSISPSGVAQWWCGVGVTGVGSGVSNKCQQTELFAPQHLFVYGGALFYLEPSVPYVGWISLTYTGNHNNMGALLSCSTSRRSGSSCPGSPAADVLSAPTAMTVDSSTGWVYLAEANGIAVCQISGGTNPGCSAVSAIVSDWSGAAGYLDGFGQAEPLTVARSSRFAGISSLYFDPVQSQLWVADAGNQRIRTLRTLITSGSTILPIITGVWPSIGPMAGSLSITLTGQLLTSSTRAYFGTSSSSAAAYTQCSSSTTAGWPSPTSVQCTISASQASALLSTQQPIYFSAFSSASQATQALTSLQSYTPNFCFADQAGTPQCTGGQQCNATARTCYYLTSHSPTAPPQPSSSAAATSPPPPSSAAATSSSASDSHRGASSSSSSAVSSSASSSAFPSSSSSPSSSLTSAPASSTGLASTADSGGSGLSSSEHSRGDSSGCSSTSDSSSSTALPSSSPVFSSASPSSTTTSTPQPSSAPSATSSSSSSSDAFASSIRSSSPSVSFSSSSSSSSSPSSSSSLSSSLSSAFPSSLPSSSFFNSAPASALPPPPPPPPPPPFAVSTISPASLVLSSDVVVNLTGRWLSRVTAVYVSGRSLAFTSYGSYSPWSEDDGDDDDDGEASGRWSVNSGRVARGMAGGRARAFHPYQSSSGACEAPSCLFGVQLMGGDNSVLSFVLSASNSSGYLPLSLTYRPVPEVEGQPPPVVSNWTGADWLYSTPVPCTTGWLVDGGCAPCPTGGYCPGGGRVWPLPGYWSYSETQLPVACGLPQSCPGALSNAQLSPDGSRSTSVCAAGYSGTFCSSCASAYYSLDQRCLSCGLQDAEKVELGILLILAVALFMAMAVCVATLSATGLSMAVAAILLLQHFSVVGKLAGQQIPSSYAWLTTLFSVMSMLNFDVTFVKPGCAVAALPFLSVYLVTLGLVVGTSGLFALASLIRARLWTLRQARQAKLASERGGGGAAGQAQPQPAMAWSWRFRARLMHSHLILGSILYLRLSTMTLQALHCTDVERDQAGGAVSVLLIDLTTRCYEGLHLPTAVLVAWPTLFLYCLGFPLLSAYLLYHHFHAAANRAADGSDPPAAVDAAAVGAAAAKAKPLPLLLFNNGEAGAVEMSAARSGRTAAAAAAGAVSPLSSSGFSSPVACSAPTSPLASPRGLHGHRWAGTTPLLVYRRSESLRSTGRRAVQAMGGEEREAVDDSADATASATSTASTPGTLTPEESKADEEGGSPAAGEGQRRRLSRPVRVDTHSSRHPSRLLSPSLVRLDHTSPSTPQSSSSSPYPNAVRQEMQREQQQPRGVLLSSGAASSTASADGRVEHQPGVDGRRPPPAQAKPRMGPSKLALRALVKDARRQELLGFMFRQLRGELYYFRLLLFVTSFGFACVAVLPTDPTLRLFLTGVFFLLDAAIVTAATPFDSRWRNCLSACMSLLGVLQIFVLLALVQLGLSSADGTIDLGHSSASQMDSQEPSASLTGVSDAAQRFELYLGILCIVEAVVLAVVRRRSLCRLAGQCGHSPQLQRLLVALSALLAAFMGRTLVQRVVVREKGAETELSAIRPCVAVQSAAVTCESHAGASTLGCPAVSGRALFDYEAVEATELSLTAGESVTIEQVNGRTGWALVLQQSSGRRGWVPREYVVERSGLQQTLSSQRLSLYSDSGRRHTEQDTSTGGEEGREGRSQAQRLMSGGAAAGVAVGSEAEQRPSAGSRTSRAAASTALSGEGGEKFRDGVGERDEAEVDEEEEQPGASPRSKSVTSAVLG